MATFLPAVSGSVWRVAFLGALVAMVIIGLFSRAPSTQVLVPLEVPPVSLVK